MRCSLVAVIGLLGLLSGRAAIASEASPALVPLSRGDLFPGAGRGTVTAATGLPLLGVAEAGIGITDGFAVGVVGAVSPGVWTFGVRPRMRFATSERTALVLAAPMLFYPEVALHGPGNIGSTSWVLARPELFFDGALGDRWHLAGGMGFIAVASTEALGQVVAGRDFQMPPYNGSTESRRGFAGGIWNTIAARSSFALDSRNHIFVEGSFVLKGIAVAEDFLGRPFVVNAGAQHSF